MRPPKDGVQPWAPHYGHGDVPVFCSTPCRSPSTLHSPSPKRATSGGTPPRSKPPGVNAPAPIWGWRTTLSDTKAYPSMPPDCLIYGLQAIGVPAHIYNMVANIYAPTNSKWECYVRMSTKGV